MLLLWLVKRVTESNQLPVVAGGGVCGCRPVASCHGSLADPGIISATFSTFSGFTSLCLDHLLAIIALFRFSELIHTTANVTFLYFACLVD